MDTFGSYDDNMKEDYDEYDLDCDDDDYEDEEEDSEMDEEHGRGDEEKQDCSWQQPAPKLFGGTYAREPPMTVSAVFRFEKCRRALGVFSPSLLSDHTPS